MNFESKILGSLCKKTNMMSDMVLTVRKEEAILLLAPSSGISPLSPLMRARKLHNGPSPQNSSVVHEDGCLFKHKPLI